MILAMASFTAGDTMTKLMAGEVPVGEIIFFRGIVATAIIMVLCIHKGVIHHVALIKRKTVLARSLSDMVGTVLFITALMHMPIANLTAIMQSVPLLATAFAALFLQERVGLRRVLAILTALAGVLLIVKPHPGSFSRYDGIALMLIAAIALRDICTRRLASDVPTLIVVLANAAIVMLSGLALKSIEEWVTLAPKHIVLIFCGSIFLCLGYVFMVLTIRLGDISATAIYRYSVVLFALASGVIVFHEVPDQWAFLGIALIVASGIYALLREVRLARLAKASGQL